MITMDNVYTLCRAASLVSGVDRCWGRLSRDGVSNLSRDAQAVWCSDAPHSWVFAAETTRQHVSCPRHAQQRMVLNMLWHYAIFTKRAICFISPWARLELIASFIKKCTSRILLPLLIIIIFIMSRIRVFSNRRDHQFQHIAVQISPLSDIVQ